MSDLDAKIYSVNDAIKIEQIAYNKAIDDIIGIVNFYKDDWDGIYHAIEEIEQLKKAR